MIRISNSWVILLLLISSAVKGEETGRNANEKEREWCWCDYLKVGAVAGVTAVAGVSFGLTAVGFTAGGVAAGSLAASIQSAVYGATVGPGTLFAVLQSTGALGIGMWAKGVIFTFVGGIATYITRIVYPSQEEPTFASGDKK